MLRTDAAASDARVCFNGWSLPGTGGWSVALVGSGAGCANRPGIANRSGRTGITHGAGQAGRPRRGAAWSGRPGRPGRAILTYSTGGALGAWLSRLPRCSRWPRLTQTLGAGRATLASWAGWASRRPGIALGTRGAGWALFSGRPGRPRSSTRADGPCSAGQANIGRQGFAVYGDLQKAHRPVCIRWRPLEQAGWKGADAAQLQVEKALLHGNAGVGFGPGCTVGQSGAALVNHLETDRVAAVQRVALGIGQAALVADQVDRILGMGGAGHEPCPADGNGPDHGTLEETAT